MRAIILALALAGCANPSAVTTQVINTVKEYTDAEAILMLNAPCLIRTGALYRVATVDQQEGVFKICVNATITPEQLEELIQ